MSGLSVMLTVLILAFVLEIVFQRFWIARMKEMKIRQVTKLYGPSWHEQTKTGTPTMGGVVFLPVLVISLLVASHMDRAVDLRNAAVIVSYPLLTSAIGFLDDWVKHSRRSSDGITSLQKLALQIAVTVFWLVFIAPRPGWPVFVWPRFAFMGYSEVLVYCVKIAVLTFVGVGLQNAVNVTDGLDGLAAGCALISFIVFLVTVFFGGNFTMFVALFAAIGICLGFLWHNCNPAAVFMGDVGAHFIAGLLFTAAMYSSNFFTIVPVCFIFGVEIASVAVQIVAIRRFGRKVFLMSPIHHHFEMKGWGEKQIVTRFCLVHIIGMAVVFLLWPLVW